MRIRARAVRRCGQLLKEIEASHNRGNPHAAAKGEAPPLSQTRKAAAADAGLSPDQAKQSIRVANVEEASSRSNSKATSRRRSPT